MKITKNALRQIIQEELNLLNEQGVKVIGTTLEPETEMVGDDEVGLVFTTIVKVGEQVQEKDRMRKEIVKLGKDPRFHAVIKSTIEDMLR